MVEDEHRRAVRPEVLLADDTQAHAGERQRGVGADRRGEVGRVAAAAVEQADPGPERARRVPARRARRPSARTVSMPGRPRPESLYAGQPRSAATLARSGLRVERRADSRRRRGSTCPRRRCRSRSCRLQVDAAPTREVTHRARLPGAPQHLAAERAGEYAVHHPDRGRQQMLHVEVLRQRRRPGSAWPTRRARPCAPCAGARARSRGRPGRPSRRSAARTAARPAP